MRNGGGWAILESARVGGVFAALHLPLRQRRSLVAVPSRTLNTRRPLLLRLLRASAMAASPPPPVDVKDRIELNDKEHRIFDRLLQVVRHYNLQTQLRVAGGWVRDKLLGKECDDIDIALDNMLGREFCDKITDYLSSTGEVTKVAAVILSNPDQSKHLETARMRLDDIWIDFVNLRAEDYSQNSRIPTMRFGTAEEDAYRRDLTINSLFYNITTSQVEDFTGRGIIDLKYGKIVTPLPPKETFLDDPLRVLRAIRFAARFGFTLDQELKIAAASAEVKAAIAGKISRERVGHEVDLMVSGNEPVKAMTYICDLSLFFVVFSLPQNFEVIEGLDRRCILNMDAIAKLLRLLDRDVISDGERRLTFYAALLLPLQKLTYIASKSKEIPLVDFIFRVSLKLKMDDAKAVIMIHNAAQKFVALIPYFTSAKDVNTMEVDWEKGLIDIPVASKLRVYAGSISILLHFNFCNF
uniref:Poly A polymerase head domain-containing protein n=1 Tax=Kalanchoe fedtschenkoi TaxID=63787 RepID=A0A7N0V1V7_KALFE